MFIPDKVDNGPIYHPLKVTEDNWDITRLLLLAPERFLIFSLKLIFKIKIVVDTLELPSIEIAFNHIEISNDLMAMCLYQMPTTPVSTRMNQLLLEWVNFYFNNIQNFSCQTHGVSEPLVALFDESYG